VELLGEPATFITREMLPGVGDLSKGGLRAELFSPWPAVLWRPLFVLTTLGRLFSVGVADEISNPAEKNMCADPQWLQESCSRSPAQCTLPEHICRDHPACPANKPSSGSAACSRDPQGGDSGCIAAVSCLPLPLRICSIPSLIPVLGRPRCGNWPHSLQPGFEVEWNMNTMPPWTVDQRIYHGYELLKTGGATLSGDFTPVYTPDSEYQKIKPIKLSNDPNQYHFSKPLSGAECVQVQATDWPKSLGCNRVTHVGNVSDFWLGFGQLAFGAHPTDKCPTVGCTAIETVSQTITIPWNAHKLYFKHRREVAGGTQSLGSYVRLLINLPSSDSVYRGVNTSGCAAMNCPTPTDDPVWPCSVPGWPCSKSVFHDPQVTCAPGYFGQCRRLANPLAWAVPTVQMACGSYRRLSVTSNAAAGGKIRAETRQHPIGARRGLQTGVRSVEFSYGRPNVPSYHLLLSPIRATSAHQTNARASTKNRRLI
jgi:hypothetical protein